MNQFDVVRATFIPQRTDDLKDRARPYIGVSGLWDAAWWIEEGSGKRIIRAEPAGTVALMTAHAAPQMPRRADKPARTAPRF